MDKICITDSAIPPTEKGETAETICNPTVGINSSKVLKGFALEQNYPNPFNSKTSISFQIPGETYVSLKVFSMLGEEIAELAGRAYSSGKHTVEFNTGNLSNGIYFYTIKADDFISSRKMILKVE